MEYQRLAPGRPDSNDAVAAVWPTAALDGMAAPAAAEAKDASFTATPAIADVASGVTRLLVATYASLIFVFFALFATSTLAAFSIVICAFYVAMFFGVPRVFLAVEAAPGRRPSFGRFMAVGIDTLTGRTGGRDALIQMLIVPAFVTLGLTAIGIIARIYIG